MEQKIVNRSKVIRYSQVYLVYKVSEGGIGQKHAMELLREKKIDCKPIRSIYVGQIAILVNGSDFEHKKVQKILYGD